MTTLAPGVPESSPVRGSGYALHEGHLPVRAADWQASWGAPAAAVENATGHELHGLHDAHPGGPGLRGQLAKRHVVEHVLAPLTDQASLWLVIGPFLE